MKRWIVVSLVLAGLGGGYWFVRTSNAAKPEAPPDARPAASRGAPVLTETLAEKSLPLLYKTIGSVQAMASVAVRSRVDSVLDRVHFSEGDEVKAGEVLFTLDARTYEAQLAVAQANLERDRANLAKAQTDVRRYEELVRSSAVSRSQLDAAVASANALEATVKADQAQVETAKLSLGFTRIVAPMDGRTGVVSVKPGAMVRSSETAALVTINQLRPILVSFNVPERHLAALRAAMAAGPVPVLAMVRDDRAQPASGRLTFIDSQIDQTTGTILAKAQFDNDDMRLWPGAFVDVTVTLSVDPKALTLPDVAVQTSQTGRYVFVVKSDGTVELRPVAVARIQDGQAVITSGLSAGERVVVEGQSRLTAGARVVDRSAAPPKDGEPAKGDGRGAKSRAPSAG